MGFVLLYHYIYTLCFLLRLAKDFFRNSLQYGLTKKLKIKMSGEETSFPHPGECWTHMFYRSLFRHMIDRYGRSLWWCSGASAMLIVAHILFLGNANEVWVIAHVLEPKSISIFLCVCIIVVSNRPHHHYDMAGHCLCHGRKCDMAYGIFYSPVTRARHCLWYHDCYSKLWYQVFLRFISVIEQLSH